VFRLRSPFEVPFHTKLVSFSVLKIKPLAPEAVSDGMRSKFFIKRESLNEPMVDPKRLLVSFRKSMQAFSYEDVNQKNCNTSKSKMLVAISKMINGFFDFIFTKLHPLKHSLKAINLN
jgi:hypothetical protein